MPMMPSGQFVPQSVLGAGGAVPNLQPTPGAAPPPVNATLSSGPGQGGAATADVAQQQVPGAQEAAGMSPGGQPGQDPTQAGQAPGQPPAAPQVPPPPAPGFVPNSQGQQLYTPGQGPITEQVPDIAQMGETAAQTPYGLPPGTSQPESPDMGEMELQAWLQTPTIGLLDRLITLYTGTPDYAGPRNKVARWQDGKAGPGVGTLSLGPARQSPLPAGSTSFSPAAGLLKSAAPIGSHGRPMISCDGPMQRTTAGEGDTSSLAIKPWNENGIDAFNELRFHAGIKNPNQGKSTFGSKPKLASVAELAIKAACTATCQKCGHYSSAGCFNVCPHCGSHSIEKTGKAESKAQQRFMGMVHATQKGEITAPSKAVAETAGEMKPSDATDFAKTKRKGLPGHVHHKKKAADLSVGHAARKKVPKGEFAMPGKAPKGEKKTKAKGKYPMPDASHAAAAKGFAAMHHGKGSAEYQAVAAKAKSLGFGKNAAGIPGLPSIGAPPAAPPAPSVAQAGPAGETSMVSAVTPHNAAISPLPGGQGVSPIGDQKLAALRAALVFTGLVKHSGGSGPFPARMLGRFVPLGERREELDADDQQDMERGRSQWHAPWIETESTPLARLMASPGKQGLLYGLGGAAVGGAAGAGIGQLAGGHPYLGGAIGAGLLGLASGAGRAWHQNKDNAEIEEILRRMPSGATKRDLNLEQMLERAMLQRFGVSKLGVDLAANLRQPALAQNPQGPQGLADNPMAEEEATETPKLQPKLALSPMAEAFLEKCADTYHMDDETIYHAAKVASSLSDVVAADLRPVIEAFEKKAVNYGKVLPWLGGAAKGLWRWGVGAGKPVIEKGLAREAAPVIEKGLAREAAPAVTRGLGSYAAPATKWTGQEVAKQLGQGALGATGGYFAGSGLSEDYGAYPGMATGFLLGMPATRGIMRSRLGPAAANRLQAMYGSTVRGGLAGFAGDWAGHQLGLEAPEHDYLSRAGAWGGLGLGAAKAFGGGGVGPLSRLGTAAPEATEAAMHGWAAAPEFAVGGGNSLLRNANKANLGFGHFERGATEGLLHPARTVRGWLGHGEPLAGKAARGTGSYWNTAGRIAGVGTFGGLGAQAGGMVGGAIVDHRTQSYIDSKLGPLAKDLGAVNENGNVDIPTLHNHLAQVVQSKAQETGSSSLMDMWESLPMPARLMLGAALLTGIGGLATGNTGMGLLGLGMGAAGAFGGYIPGMEKYLGRLGSKPEQEGPVPIPNYPVRPGAAIGGQGATDAGQGTSPIGEPLPPYEAAITKIPALREAHVTPQEYQQVLQMFQTGKIKQDPQQLMKMNARQIDQALRYLRIRSGGDVVQGGVPLPGPQGIPGPQAMPYGPQMQGMGSPDALGEAAAYA